MSEPEPDVQPDQPLVRITFRDSGRPGWVLLDLTAANGMTRTVRVPRAPLELLPSPVAGTPFTITDPVFRTPRRLRDTGDMLAAADKAGFGDVERGGLLPHFLAEAGRTRTAFEVTRLILWMFQGRGHTPLGRFGADMDRPFAYVDVLVADPELRTASAELLSEIQRIAEVDRFDAPKRKGSPPSVPEHQWDVRNRLAAETRSARHKAGVTYSRWICLEAHQATR